ncbi:MAG: ABC transporter ATP-binding protein [Lachnospiraceae bacterium]|nr:ABC transporter ATP-binding protein [Lachnospiraceae bacterium]
MEVILEHLTKTFPSRDKKNPAEVIAVNDFDFAIPDGKLIGLLGPSGCGKSTTLNLICGLLAPTSGRILFGDSDVTNLPPEARGVGLVFQNYALYPHLTVRQNILFPLQNLRGEDKLTKEEMNAKAEEAAKLVQIDMLMERKPKELSGGQQQRVAIARALVKRPQVLLLDEPLSNLDARLRLQTREEIKRIQTETGITTIFVTHDQEEAMSISDLIVVMKDGILQQIGKPQEVYDEPVNMFVAKFLGTPQINMFDGRVSGGLLYLGDTPVLKTDAPDGDVHVGVRPEGFILAGSGTDAASAGGSGATAAGSADSADAYEGTEPLICELKAVEVSGRDVSIVSTHSASQSANIRAIMGSDRNMRVTGTKVGFRLKPEKVYLFDKETEKRIQ